MSEQWTAPGNDPTRPPELPPPGPGWAGPGPGLGAAGPVATGWRPGFDFRPGIIPLRPLLLGDLYGGLIKAIRGNVAATVGLAALTSVLFIVPTTALGALVASSDAGVALPGPAVPGEVPITFGPAMFANYLPSIGQALSGILLAGFMAYVVGQAVLGRKVSLEETWTGTKHRVLPMIGATLLIALAWLVAALVCVGLPLVIIVTVVLDGWKPATSTIVLLVVAGIALFVLMALVSLYVTTRLSFTTSMIVLEGQGVTASLARSWRLVGGLRGAPFWRVFGIRLLTSVIVGFASSIVALPLVALMMLVLGSTGPGEGAISTVMLFETVITGLVGILSGALTIPFTAGINALLYVDARMRTEGLDLALLHASDGSGPLPWPSAAPQ